MSLSRHRGHLLFFLGIVSATALLCAIGAGSVELSWSQIWQALSGEGDELHRRLLVELRLPRALNAFATGGLLALSGALMQVLVRNPLADPYVLGVSGGAGTVALTLLLLGITGPWLNIGAFFGALAAMLLVIGIARATGSWSATRLLLTGVVMASGWGAVIGLLLALSPGVSLQAMIYWLMGDLGRAVDPLPGLVVLATGTAVCLTLARGLNTFSLGELPARALGIEVTPMRGGIYAIASLLTATAVTIAGTVGFVGLVVPHLMRLLGGSDHRWLVPATVLLGGTLLVVADTLARTLLAPRQLPVGALTAVLGVPLFLYLLQRSR